MRVICFIFFIFRCFAYLFTKPLQDNSSTRGLLEQKTSNCDVKNGGDGNWR